MLGLNMQRYGSKRLLRPQRPTDFWGAARRSQLLELFVLTGGIAMVWFGAQWDNAPRALSSVTLPITLESAKGDLAVGVPVGKHRRQSRPL